MAKLLEALTIMDDRDDRGYLKILWIFILRKIKLWIVWRDFKGFS